MLEEEKLIFLLILKKIGGNLMSAQNDQGPQIPILLLKEGTSQTKGRDAKRNNIAAAKQVANIVKGSLATKGTLFFASFFATILTIHAINMINYLLLSLYGYTTLSE